jgi:outer membrane protein insertion porin family
MLICLSESGHGMDRAELRWIRSKPPIDSSVISGCSFFKASEIKKQMYSRKRSFWKMIKGDRRTRIQRETYGRDTLEIKYLYLSKGFLGVQVQEDFEVLGDDSSALIHVVVHEGRQFHYGKKKVTGSFENRLASDFVKIAAGQKEGKPINLFDLHDDAFDMKTILANEGYPYATVSFNLDTNDTRPRADVSFHIVSDSLVRFGDVSIKGAHRYPEEVARRELKIKPGELYRRNDIIDSQRRLVEAGYFSTFQLRRADTLADRLRPDFVLRVRERKPTFVTFKTGVGQSEVRDLTWDFSTGFNHGFWEYVCPSP